MKNVMSVSIDIIRFIYIYYRILHYYIYTYTRVGEIKYIFYKR